MRKKRHEEPENHERWLITYADMITLLMVFFIVLHAMSSIEKAKTDSLIESLYNAFNHIAVLDTDSGGSQPTQAKPIVVPPVPEETKSVPEESPQERQLQNLKAKLQQYIDSHNLKLMVSLTDNNRGVQLTLKDVILFDSGLANLKSDFLPTLHDIAQLLKTVDNQVSIEGHTDNRPIRTVQFDSNWELSSARALAVLHYFETQNIKSQRLQFTGYGEFHPIYPNDTEEHRQANRRVNILILRN